MTTVVMAGFRPYHETIKEAIHRASNEGMQELAPLIKATIIPKPEAIDEVVLAWNEKCRAMCWGDEDLGVPASLLRQK